MNADAMGKSMQGAGGALVLGTVFKSIISRTQLSAEVREKYPEQWLKECYMELQSVFTSFDGTMLISAIFGLVHKSSGLFYFINAEHPWAVLYRDGQADFIEDELYLRKIGVSAEGLEADTQIRTFQLQKNDVLILGSDGRDDLMLNVSDSGQRQINEDEKLFLKSVKAASADLQAIEGELKRKGSLTDDLSLLKISFLGQPISTKSVERDILNQNQSTIVQSSVEKANSEILRLENVIKGGEIDPDILCDLLDLYVYNQDFTKASSVALNCSRALPHNTEFLYFASYSFKNKYLNDKDQNLEDLIAACDFGERCRLREPSSVKNLENLADAYLLLSNFQRAKLLLDAVLKKDPGNKEAIRLKEKTEEGLAAESKRKQKTTSSVDNNYLLN